MAIACSHSLYILNNNSKPIKQCLLPIAFAISDESPELLKSTLRAGIQYWNDALRYDIFLDFGDTGFVMDSPESGGLLMIGVVSELSKSNYYIRTRTYTCGKTEFAYNRDGCIIRAKIKINSLCADDFNKVQTIVRHEAGHVLGLSDSIDFTALMSSKIERTMQHPVDANEKEIAAVRKLYNLENK